MPITATTAAIIGSIAAIGGLGVSVIGAITSGQQQQKAAEAQADAQRRAQATQAEGQRQAQEENAQAYDAQAEASRRNQQVAEENAQATETAAAWDEKQARLKAIRLAGTQRVTYAKTGVLPEGSPLDVMAETAALEEQDILATRYNYGVQAARYRSQADFYGYEGGRQDIMASNLRARKITDLSIYPINTPNYATAGILKAGTSLLTTTEKLAKYWDGSTLGKSTYNPDISGSGWGSL